MLRDHFHPPLKDERDWHGFHHAWAVEIAADLNRSLPERYFAEPSIQYNIEVDVGAMERYKSEGDDLVREAAAATVWSLPCPAQTLPVEILSDLVEVLVYYDLGGRRLVAAVELVSPSNKDRPSSRSAFVSKCASLLQQGIGLLIIDVVTDRRANLHNALLARLAPPEWIPMEAVLYAASYHVEERNSTPTLDTWEQPLTVGQELPKMPLFLRGGPHVELPLDETYERTLKSIRIY